jgi:CheY-like chemotaxis protein
MMKVAVIDDEKDLCGLIKDILERTGKYQVVIAHDGKSGEALCLKEIPDLIFLDFIMPVEKGDKVIEFLKTHNETKNIPIILMSGLGEMVYFQNKHQWRWLPNTATVEKRGNVPESMLWKKVPEEVAKEMGVAIYLAKPFNSAILLEVVQSIFDL